MGPADPDRRGKVSNLLVCVFPINARGKRRNNSWRVIQSRRWSHSHKVIITKTVVVILAGVRLSITAGIQRDLGLRRLRLLVAFVRSTLLTHLFVASGCESTGNLLDFSTRELLHKLASEVLRPERVLGLLRVRSEQRHEDFGDAVELVLCGGLEERHGGQIDRVGGVLGISNDNSLGGTLVALEIDGAEQILGVGKIGFLFGLAQTSTALSLVFAFGLAEVLALKTVLLAVLFYPLSFGLLVGQGLGLSGGFGFGGLLGLLALDLGVFTGIP